MKGDREVKMNIYDWDMKIEKVDKYSKEYMTPNKIYEVRNGKIILDKDYEHSSEKFSLEGFKEKWSKDWVVLRIKIDGVWYKIEKEN